MAVGIALAVLQTGIVQVLLAGQLDQGSAPVQKPVLELKIDRADPLAAPVPVPEPISLLPDAVAEVVAAKITPAVSLGPGIDELDAKLAVVVATVAAPVWLFALVLVLGFRVLPSYHDHFERLA